jgi:hypothetical protein
MDIKTYQANWYKQNRERILVMRKAYHKANAATICARSKKWREENHDQFISYLDRYRLENKAKLHEQQRALKALKRKKDPLYRLQLRLRWRLWSVVRGIKGYTQKTKDLLGCSLTEFKSHLESLFQAGMSWDNYGEWHIDHIIPCARFDFSSESQQKACFHYTNLQPLWGRDNAAKGARDNTEGSRQSVMATP